MFIFLFLRKWVLCFFVTILHIFVNYTNIHNLFLYWYVVILRLAVSRNCCYRLRWDHVIKCVISRCIQVLSGVVFSLRQGVSSGMKTCGCLTFLLQTESEGESRPLLQETHLSLHGSTLNLNLTQIYLYTIGKYFIEVYCYIFTF